MQEEPEKKKVSIEVLKESLANLRYKVAGFQDSIEAYLNAIDETWRDVKSRLASVEARLAAMEVRLSAMPPEPEWQVEELNGMLKDLDAVGVEIEKMRQRFFSFAEGTLERVN
jgi:septal ring factor EnvC (AmiA/AmiB activator)